MLSLKEFLDAYQMTDFGVLTETRAFLNADDYSILVTSDFEEDDEEDVESRLANGRWIEFPNRHDLDLGKRLALRFADEYLDDAGYDRVCDFFSRSGAYGRYKDFLEDRGLLQKWYEYSELAEVNAVRWWLEENKISYKDDVDLK